MCSSACLIALLSFIWAKLFSHLVQFQVAVSSSYLSVPFCFPVFLVVLVVLVLSCIRTCRYYSPVYWSFFVVSPPRLQSDGSTLHCGQVLNTLAPCMFDLFPILRTHISFVRVVHSALSL